MKRLILCAALSAFALSCWAEDAKSDKKPVPAQGEKAGCCKDKEGGCCKDKQDAKDAKGGCCGKKDAKPEQPAKK